MATSSSPRYQETTVREGVNPDAATRSALETLGEDGNRAKFQAVFKVLGEVSSGVNPRLTVKHVYDHPYPNVRIYQDDQPLVNVSIYMISATASFSGATHGSAFRGESTTEWDEAFEWVAAFTGFPSQRSWDPELQIIA